MPGSYKLWYNFLKESRKFVKKNIHEFLGNEDDHDSQTNEFTEVIEDLFERALIYLTKMPKIWLDYAKFLSNHCKSVTKTRQIYNRALVALPVTQHSLVWEQCLDWACSLEDFTETGCHFFRRYIQFKPEDTEDYIDYLLKNDLLEEALEQYLLILNDDGFVSKRGNKSKYQLWMELCEFISRNPKRA